MINQVSVADYDALRQRIREKNIEDHLRERMCAVKDQLPLRYREASITSFPQESHAQRQALKTMRKYADTFKQRLGDGTCLILSGDVGTGKTFMACALLLEVARRRYTVKYTTCAQMLSAIRSVGWQQESGVIQKYIQPQLLILDETPNDDFSASDKKRLFQVIDGRYQQCYPTIVVTNLNQPNLLSVIGKRIFDRLMHGGALIAFSWDSLRTKTQY